MLVHAVLQGSITVVPSDLVRSVMVAAFLTSKSFQSVLDFSSVAAEICPLATRGITQSMVYFWMDAWSVGELILTSPNASSIIAFILMKAPCDSLSLSYPVMAKFSSVLLVNQSPRLPTTAAGNPTAAGTSAITRVPRLLLSVT